MTKAFKFFNVLQIIVYIILALGALVMVAVTASEMFELAFLAPVIEFVAEYAMFIPMAYATSAVSYLLELVPSIATYGSYILIGLNTFVFLWLFIMAMRMCRPHKHYRKFKWFTFTLMLLITAVMVFNAVQLLPALTEGAMDTTILIAVIIDAMFLVELISYFIMNLCGRHQIRENTNLDPANFFDGGPNNFARTNNSYGVTQRQGPPPAPPARRGPPPPPPPRF